MLAFVQKILPKDNSSGFTLIEVLVVVTLIAIMSSIAIISLAFYIPNLQLKSTAQDINIQIQKARLEGIRRSKPVAVHFFATDVSGSQKYGPIIWIDEDLDSTLDAGEDVLFRMPVNEYATNRWAVVDDNHVYFNPDKDGDGIDDADTDGVSLAGNNFLFNSRGIANKSGSVFLVNSRGRTKQVMVTLGGAVRVF